MTLFEAKPPDLRKDRTREILIWGAVVAVIVIAIMAFVLRHWPHERVVGAFFTKIEQQDYRVAFGIWNADPDWEQHPDRYRDYTFGQFQLDWGPTGDYGKITGHKVEGSVEPRGIDSVTGIVVAVRVNNRATPACIWVDKRTKALSFSPMECKF